MANCAQCGVDILFGGVRDDGLRFCGRRCHDQYTEWITNLKAAHRAYQELLSRLRQSPTDPQLKQKTLEAGRSYASWSRRGRSATVFDEVALANDIQAACAAASTLSTPATVALTVEQRLERLESLRQRALISDQEYDAKRKDILAEL
jgi:hypothetical protein